MKAGRSLWRWALFLLISWAIYNSSLPMFLGLSIWEDLRRGNSAGIAIISLLKGDWGYFYGLSYFFPEISRLLNPELWWLAALFWLYILGVNTGAAYLWLRRQTVARAWLLAIAACFAGPYSGSMFNRSPLWSLGVGGCSFCWLLLSLAIRLRKKKNPEHPLPALLVEWRMPGLVPPLSRFSPLHFIKTLLAEFRKRFPAPIPRPPWPLFLAISWIIYSTAPLSGTLAAFFLADDAELATTLFVNTFLLDGIYDSDTLTFFGAILFYPMGGESPLAHAPLWLYLIAVNGGAAYFWLREQSIGSAWLLAMAGCCAGPYTLLLFQAPGLWLYGFMGACLFYALLLPADIFLKKKFAPRS